MPPTRLQWSSCDGQLGSGLTPLRTWSRRYNKTEANFDSKQDWDDYLEEREDLSARL